MRISSRAWLPVLVLAAASCSRSRDGNGTRPAERATPVAVTRAERRDVPIYLEGLGSVIAYETVAVRTQVDGRLDRVLFQEGQTVRRGDVLAQIDPRPFQNQLLQAQGALARDEAQLTASKRDYDRYQELAKRNLISRQQAEDQLAVAGQAEGAVRIDQAAIDAAKLNLDYARITSPIDGVVGIRSVDPGNLVHVADTSPIVVVTKLDPIAVIFSLPQDQLSEVAQHQREGPLEVQVSSRDGSTPLGQGQLLVIDNAINAGTATMRLKAVLPNPAHALWPNQFVKVRLKVTVQPNVIVVPAPAVQRGPKGTFVYAVGSDQTAQPQPIRLDRVQGDLALVASGLEPGTVVVTEGQGQLKPGSKVAARPSGAAETPPASPAVGAAGFGSDGGGGGGRSRAAAPADPPAPAQKAPARGRQPGETASENGGGGGRDGAQSP